MATYKGNASYYWLLDEYNANLITDCQVLDIFVQKRVSNDPNVPANLKNYLNNISNNNYNNQQALNLYMPALMLLAHGNEAVIAQNITNNATTCGLDAAIANKYFGGRESNAQQLIDYYHAEWSDEASGSMWTILADKTTPLSTTIQISPYDATYKRWMADVMGLYIEQGIGDVVSWLTLAALISMIGGVETWVKSLNLPTWVYDLISGALGWTTGQLQKQQQNAMTDLSGVVNVLSEGNQALDSILQTGINWLANNVPQMLTDYVKQQVQAAMQAAALQAQTQADAANTANSLQTANIQHIDQLSKQLSVQLGANQDALLTALNQARVMNLTYH